MIVYQYNNSTKNKIVLSAKGEYLIECHIRFSYNSTYEMFSLEFSHNQIFLDYNIKIRLFHT